jgi:hypothetical protein
MNAHVTTKAQVPDPSDSSWLSSALHSLVEQAIMLEKSYKEMLIQGDEVDRRVQLWREAIAICKINSESTSLMYN